jgi:hypothetical protein
MDYINLIDYIDKYNLSDKIYPSDIDCYINIPDYNFVYNKLWLSKSQKMLCGPMGVYPAKYPIIFKPIVNLYGLSRGFKIIHNIDEYDLEKKDGFFWQPYFEGKHIVCDFVLDNTKIIFSSCLRSYPCEKGSFKLHHTTKYEIPKNIIYWINTNMKNYRGCLNMDVIDGNIIECHLRLNGDFNLYNKDFCFQLSDFMEGKIETIDYKIPKIYIFPVFIEREHLERFVQKKTIIKKLLKKYSKTIYFDDVDAEYQAQLLRVLVFDTYNFLDGLKLQKIINNNI